jgi:hypothetical protein
VSRAFHRGGGLVLALGLAALLDACSEAPRCGAGTYLESDECKAGVAPICGPGTVLENGACVPEQGEGGECGPGTHLDEGVCVGDVSVQGNASRLYDVHLVDPPEFVDLADPSLHGSFMSGANLVFVGVYQPTLQVLHLFGGGGERADDGTFTLDRTTAFEAPATASASGFETGPFSFQLSGLGSSRPVQLVDTRLTEVQIDRSSGAALVESGRLSGVLTREAASAVFIDQANETLLALLDSIGIPPTDDRDGDGVKESWRMTLQFSTTPVWLF